MEHLTSIICIFVHCTQLFASVQELRHGWNYDKNGEDWTHNCDTRRQSPIDLYPTGSNYVCKITTFHGCFIPRIRFTDYNQLSKNPPILTNNGHSASLAIPHTVNVDRPEITGAFLKGVYIAEELHFHWGSNNSLGSEHTINGTRYDIEMHIVHRNKRYDDIDTASTYADGMAVLGVMINIDRNQTKPSAGLRYIFNSLPKITKYHTKTKLPVNISIDNILSGLNKTSFYLYRGSYTTPKCSAPLTWIVFRKHLTVPLSEAAKLWQLRDERGKPIQNNFRLLQPRTYRGVYYRPSL